MLSGSTLKLVSKTLLSSFGIVLLMMVVQNAAAQQPDIEPPSIEHEQVPFGAPNSDQIFSATVIDNVAVDQVVLNYRLTTQEQGYRTERMSNSVDNEYRAVLMGTFIEGDAIEYFITATDMAGNRSASGFDFAPLQRELSSGSSEQFNIEAAAQSKSKFNLLYVALGVLAAGALVGLSSAGGDGGGAQECPSGGCSLTLTLPSPR